MLLNQFGILEAYPPKTSFANAVPTPYRVMHLDLTDEEAARSDPGVERAAEGGREGFGNS
jgi:hypothetical protein